MVKLEEVPDEELLAPQPGPLKDDEDEWDTDSDSVLSDPDDSDSPLDETLLDRLAALKDIVPPTYRKQLSQAASTGYTWGSRAVGLGGSALWVLSTSALLLGVPWALAFSEEQQVQEMEREMRMQQNAQGLLTQGAPAGAAPAL